MNKLAVILAALYGSAAAQPVPMDKLLAALRDKDCRVQLKAIADIERFGPGSGAAVVPLVAALKDRNSYVRRAAGSALYKVGAPDPKDKDALIALLKDKDPAVRHGAIRALSMLERVGEDMVPIFEVLLFDKDEELAMGAAAVLRRSKSAGLVVGRLVLALEGPDKRRALRAAKVVAVLGEPGEKASNALIRAAQGRDRALAIQAMRTLGNLPVGPAVISLLIEKLQGSDKMAAVEAANILAQVGPGARAAAPALLRAMKSRNHELSYAAMKAIARLGSAAKDLEPELLKDARSKDREVREHAVNVLASLPPTPASVRLMNEAAFDDSDEISAVATRALVRWNRAGELTAAVRSRLEGKNSRSLERSLKVAAQIGPEAAPVSGQVARLVSSDDRKVASQAARTLSQLPPDSRSVQVLTQAVERRDPVVAPVAIEALRSIGPEAKEAAPALRAAADGRDRRLSASAKLALETIDAPKVPAAQRQKTPVKPAFDCNKGY